MKGMWQAVGGFTEYEWFGENLSIMSVLNQYILDYFVILVYDVLGESSNFETPCNDC